MATTEEGLHSGSHLTLSIWHPDCWTLEVTEHAEGGLFGHGVYTVEDQAKGRFTVYGESEDEVESLLDAIEESPLTNSVWRMNHRYDFDTPMPAPGNTIRSVLVEYEEADSINDALVSHGFIPNKAVWIHDGREYWTVVIEENRDQIRERLGVIRDEMDADIEVQHIVSEDGDTEGVLQRSVLSQRQRDVFEFARERGYYEWPREVSATDLADELGVSKATVLEHLRKAESRLFDRLP